MSRVGWACVSLGDVATFASGKTPPRSRQAEYFDAGTIPWVKTMDLNNGYISQTGERITSRAVSETGIQVHPAGTVLVAMYGGFAQIGRTGALRVAAATNQAITAILPNSSQLHPGYLLHVLNHNVGYWRTVASSSRKDPNITKADVKDFPLRLPGIDEQKMISETLDDIDGFVSALKRLIAKKQAIKQGLMQQFLTEKVRLPGFAEPWRKASLGSVLRVCHGKNQRAVEVTSGAYPILATGGQIGWASKPLYSRPSVLIGRKGTIDRPQFQATPFWTVDTLFYTEISAAVDPRYLYYLFLTIDWKSMNEASGVPSLSLRRIEGIEVKLPRIDEQRAIREVLDDADAEIASLHDRLDKAHNVKIGMMQELLIGGKRLPEEGEAAV